MPATPAHIRLDQSNKSIECSGNWLTTTIGHLPQLIRDYVRKATSQVVVDAAQIKRIDTAGAWLLHELLNQLQAAGKRAELQGLPDEYHDLYDLIAKQSENMEPIPKIKKPNLLYIIGKEAVFKASQGLEFITFLGEFTLEFFQALLRPYKIQWLGFLDIIDLAGYRALPIIALLQFLIGIVLAYQMGQQLKLYGAEIYIISLGGIAVIQEFGPLITAIIVAGRTGAAFTAQLGAMKVNEEIDALRTMGISPINRLVLPRVLGLMVTLPLLTIWADIFGIWGAMLMSKHYLNIGYNTFLTRLPIDVAFKNYIIGMCKTPIFALIIAMVGCFQGMQVGFGADSIGQKTTKSVVQSIFFIIIVDAIFSVVFGW